MSDYTNYDAAIQAIQDAQQAVDSKYKAIGEASSTLCDVNQTIVQIPDGSVTRNRDGDVIGYDYKYTTPQLPDVGIIGVDSNTDTGSFPEATGGGGHSSGGGAGRYRGSYYAGEVVDDPQSTDKAKSTGLVSGLVSAAWAGVSTLSKLGKNVAAGAADALDAMGAHFGANFGNFYVDAPAGDALRALFGVDNQGNTSMYLDEDTIGALAIQARDDGFFNAGEPTFPPEQTTGSVTITSFLDPFTQLNTLLSYAQYPLEWDSGVYQHALDFLSQYAKYYTRMAICKITPTVRQSTIFLHCSVDSNPEAPKIGGTYPCGSQYVGHLLTLQMKLVNGKSVVYDGSEGSQQIDLTVGDYDSAGNYRTISNVNGIVSQTIPGLSDQDDATSVVDAITGADPHVVAQNLESQYPSVMGTPVQVVVMDDSCNSKTINYYKVPISYSPTNLNIGAPITGGLQVSPSFNPDVQLDLPDINMDNYIDQIIKVLGGSGAGRDVTTEPVPDDPDIPSSEIGDTGVTYDAPDTGTGDTPPTTDPVVAVESMWHIYHALPAQLSALGQWLWSANIIDQIVRTFQNPMEAIMGVHALYVEPPFSSSQVPIVVGNLTSTANAYPLTGQYQALDCGYVWLTEYFGNVFDYDPFTEVSLYLPFVGIVKLDTADVMRAKISVIYGIDCYTGACLAKVSVNRDGAGGVLYEYPGNCAVEYPVSGASYSRMLQSIVAAGMSAISVGMATGGAPGTEALGALKAGATFLKSGEKISVQRAGSLGGNAGVMGAKIPYLIVSRPQPNTAYLFPHYQGIPVNKTVKVSECSGYQRFESVHLKCPFAYKEELEEIEMLLKKGILI